MVLHLNAKDIDIQRRLVNIYDIEAVTVKVQLEDGIVNSRAKIETRVTNLVSPPHARPTVMKIKRALINSSHVIGG